MDKKTIKEIEARLDILTEEARRSEISALEKNNNPNINVDIVVSNILKRRGIDESKVSKKTGIVTKTFDTLFKTVNNVVEAMDNNTAKQNAKIILDILLLILVVILLKIPFEFVCDLGEQVMVDFVHPRVLDIWNVAFEIIYVIVAVVVFINIFNRWFSKLKTEPKNKIKGKSLEGITLSENKEE